MSNVRGNLVKFSKRLHLNSTRITVVLFFSEIWDLGRYCREKQVEYQDRGSASRRNVVPGKLLKELEEDGPAAKKIKLGENVIEKNVVFYRTHYEDGKFLPASHNRLC